MSNEAGTLPAKKDEQPDLRVLVTLLSKALELEASRVAVSTKEAEVISRCPEGRGRGQRAAVSIPLQSF